MSEIIKNEVTELVNSILEDYKNGRTIDNAELWNQPDTDIIKDITSKLLKIVFPGYFREQGYKFYTLSSRLTVLIEDVMYNLNRQINIVLKQMPESAGKSEAEIDKRAQELCISYFKMIPEIRALIDTDVKATYDGDPAAFNYNEIILCYPGLYAIAVSRLAHGLVTLGVPLIPRIMTEQAHSRTGIDINPGATIGKYFFIDHGTGIVVGETTIIGDNVKIYQGVTIGALSTRGGQRLKGAKRHPTIEDNVTIYSGASILGGETIIGHDSVIGSNVFITKSVAPNTRVTIKNLELNMKQFDDGSSTSW